MKIKVIKNPWKDTLSVLFYEEVNESSYGKRWVVKPLKLELEEIKDGEIIDPTFEISRHESQDFLLSMAKIAEEMGVKTDKQLTEETRNKGVLDATKYHLEDMRNLVFNIDPNINPNDVTIIPETKVRKDREGVRNGQKD